MINIQKCKIIIKMDEYELFEVFYELSEMQNAFSFFLDDSFDIEDTDKYVWTMIEPCKYEIQLLHESSSLIIRYRRKCCGAIAFFNQIIWLPIPVEDYMMSEIEINVNKSDIRFGNIHRTKQIKIENIVMVEVPNEEIVFDVSEQKIIKCKDDVFMLKDLKSELQKLLIAFEEITNQKASFLCICNDSIPALSVSYLNLIVCNSKLLIHGKCAFYLYFVHELFHQIIGNTVVFKGAGKLWITEAFTEFLQLHYLWIRFGNNIYKNRCLYYEEVFEKYREFETEWNSISLVTNEEAFMATIASKGVLLFAYYLRDCDTKQLNGFIQLLVDVQGPIETTAFWRMFNMHFKISEEKQLLKDSKGLDYEMKKWLEEMK